MIDDIQPINRDLKIKKNYYRAGDIVDAPFAKNETWASNPSRCRTAAWALEFKVVNRF
jgi:hypothetical protein